MNIYRHIKFASLFAVGAALTACGAEGDDQGYEFAPNMYHSVPYDPLTQITDESAGNAAEWLDANNDGHGEYYNSNPINPYGMTMRMPPENTVRRTRNNFLPYNIPADSLALASRTVENPLPKTDEVVAQGQLLYSRFCDHCHGGAGQGPNEGSVGEVFAGVPGFNSAAVKNATEGHIFHVITHGKGRMQPHGPLLDVEERWKIVRYVQQLQKQ